MRALEPEHTVASVKRFIGRRVGEEADDAAYHVVGRKGEPVKVQARGVTFSFVTTEQFQV